MSWQKYVTKRLVNTRKLPLFATKTAYSIGRFSYGLEMKTREQNGNNKRTDIERFDWFTERIRTRVAFGWLSEHSEEKTSCLRTF